MTTSKLKSDVAAITCNADGCMIQLEQSEDNCTTVEYGRGVSVYFKKSEGTLIIKHSMGLLARLLGGESRVKVRVPGHVVPDVSIYGNMTDCTIEGGIYGEVKFLAASGNLRAENAAMENCTVNSADCGIRLSHCTIKGSLLANTKSGDVALEYVFATHIACRAKAGNIGAVQLNCRDTIFETGEGNINATLLGDEDAFDMVLNAKEGTCNRESVNVERNTAAFKAYAAKGNIAADFIRGGED